jgi:hypothetical protein
MLLSEPKPGPGPGEDVTELDVEVIAHGRRGVTDFTPTP